MKHLKVFNEFFFFGGDGGFFQSLCKKLDEITFDDQSHPDNKIPKVSIYKEMENRGGLDRLEEALDRFIKKDRFEEMPYDVVLKRGVNDLFDEIDIAIGTSSKQESELKTLLSNFLQPIMRMKRG